MEPGENIGMVRGGLFWSESFTIINVFYPEIREYPTPTIKDWGEINESSKICSFYPS